MEFLCGFGFAVYSFVLIYCIIMILVFNERVHNLQRKQKVLELKVQNVNLELSNIKSELIDIKSETEIKGKHANLFEGERANGD